MHTLYMNMLFFYSSIPDATRNEVSSPIPLLKACKNANELEGMRQCHRRDGAAVVSFLSWLQETICPKTQRAQEEKTEEKKKHVSAVASKTSISEVEIDVQLMQCRRNYSPELFLGRSFDTIAGVNGNGAIIHYRWL